jgi:hypothetical protein
LKLHKESSRTTQIKRAKDLAKREQIHFENSIKDFYNPKDHVVLKALDFTVENKEYHVIFDDDDYVKKKQKLQSIAYVQDVENILMMYIVILQLWNQCYHENMLFLKPVKKLMHVWKN